MILYLQLKETCRNKRFILFTLIFPVLWFLFMLNLSKSSNFYSKSFTELYIITSCLMGVSGNSVVSFAAAIGKSRKFYRLQDKISLYSSKKYLVDQLKSQLILNALICLVVLAAALLSNQLRFTASLGVSLLIITIMGIYLSILGYLLGICLDTKTIQALSFPIMTVIMFLFIPFYTWLSGAFADTMTNIQKLFPGYYLYVIMQQLFDHLNPWTSLLKFSVILLATGFIFLVTIRIAQTKYER